MENNFLAQPKFIVKIDIEKFNSVIGNQILNENTMKFSKQNKFAHLDKDIEIITHNLNGINSSNTERKEQEFSHNDLNTEVNNIKNTINKHKSDKEAQETGKTNHLPKSIKGRG
ncbi:MAG: hypothetical protein ACK4OM_06965 [Alphaproteobacteria bacterium]